LGASLNRGLSCRGVVSLGSVFLSQSPVLLFLRLPLEQRSFFSVWGASLSRGLSCRGEVSLGGERFGRGTENEKFEEGDGYIEE
jgi:hypothetical protein